MLISVIMSVYNAEEYLCEAIDSILMQNHKTFELIIVDDGSTDRSADIIRQYANLDGRIILISNEKNIGLPKSLNKAILFSKGEYIARHDADDRSAPERFSIQAAYAGAHPETDLIGSDCYVIDINGDIVCENNSYSAITDPWTNLLERKAIFTHGSAFIKKSSLINVGLYDERFYYSQDGELWLRFLSRGAKVHTIAKPLYHYRVLPLQTVKKYNAQASFNEVKHMMYVHHSSDTEVATKLEEIAGIIAEKKPQTSVKNYKSIYWKTLANIAYFNKASNWTIPYRYLFRALKENELKQNTIYLLKLGILYLMPRFITAKLRRQ